MKVDNIQAVQEILKQQQMPQPFRQGDFVMSEVVKVQDGTAVLRTAQGTLLFANLTGHLNLLPGDRVETVVVEASPGRFVLRVLDIIRSDTAAPEPNQIETPAQFFQPQTLHSALTMLKMNTNLVPKAAEFMARNGIPATPENISTLGQLAGEGPRVAQLLTRMIAEPVLVMTPSENMPDPGIAAILTGVSIEPEQGRYDSPGAAPQDTAAQAQADVAAKTQAQAGPPAAGPHASFAPTPGNTAAAPQNAATSVQPDMPAAAPGTSGAALTPPAETNPAASPATAQASAANTPPDASAQAAAAAPQADTTIQSNTPLFRPDSSSVPDGVKANRAIASYLTLPEKANSGGEEPASLLQRLASLFVDLKDRENLPARLRGAVRELPVQVKELKNSLLSTDSNVRNGWGQQAEQLDRQLSMLADIKRFHCYHIPLTTAQEAPSTAELYVYRQKRRKKDQAPDSYAVLIGLDTQHMGRVEAMIRARGRSITLEFRLEQESLAGEFEKGAKALAPAIEQAGYYLGSISVCPLAAKTTVLNAEDVLTEGHAADTGGLDIRI
ncbi:MAG: hypothetical protein ACOX8N_03305 [Christensenellales bacterium]|jgi:hypothetical protein